MSFLSRIFGRARREREPLQPLWRRIVEIARDRRWYADCGVADTVSGRFDAITLVLALVLLRMERERPLIEPSVRLTEIFIEDMDGQLRQSGVGDVVVGKHVGKLMGVLGGRLGAYRDALPLGRAAVARAIERNMTLIEGANTDRLADEALALAQRLDEAGAEALLAAEI